MKIEGHLIKNEKTGRFYAVEIPALGIHTQGKSKKEAYEMAKDAVEMVVDEEGFSVKIEPLDDLSFAIAANNVRLLIAAILRRKRDDKHLTALQVAKRMGEKSVTGYLRYEQGKSLPSLEKFSSIMVAIDPSYEPILKIG